MKVSIIIPVYNEEKSLEEIVDRVYSVKINAVEKEIIISMMDHPTTRVRSSRNCIINIQT